jgi:hypothetical protein
MDKATTNVSTLNAIPRSEVGPPFNGAGSGRSACPIGSSCAFDAFESTAARQCAESTRGLLLCAARVGRPDHKRGYPDFDAGPGLRLDARHPQPRTSGSLAADHQGGARVRTIDTASRWKSTRIRGGSISTGGGTRPRSASAA